MKKHIVYQPKHSKKTLDTFKKSLVKVEKINSTDISEMFGNAVFEKPDDLENLGTVPSDVKIIIWYLAHSYPGSEHIFDIEQTISGDQRWEKTVQEATFELCEHITKIKSWFSSASSVQISIKCWICWSSLPKIFDYQEEDDAQEKLEAFCYTGPKLGDVADMKELKEATKELIDHQYQNPLFDKHKHQPVAKKIAAALREKEISDVQVLGYPGNLLSHLPKGSLIKGDVDPNKTSLCMRWGCLDEEEISDMYWLFKLDEELEKAELYDIRERKRFKDLLNYIKNPYCLIVHAEEFASVF